MALTIYEFGNIRDTLGHEMQIPDGQPLVKHATNGAKTMGATTNIIKITGTGTITWANSVAEVFDAAEFRGVAPGTVFTVS